MMIRWTLDTQGHLIAEVLRARRSPSTPPPALLLHRLLLV